MIGFGLGHLQHAMLGSGQQRFELFDMRVEAPFTKLSGEVFGNRLRRRSAGEMGLVGELLNGVADALRVGRGLRFGLPGLLCGDCAGREAANGGVGSQ